MIRDTAAGVLENRVVAVDPTGLATCPLCHTPDAVVTNQAVSGGASWTCSRCSHPWDRMRLATATAYALSLSQRAAGNSNGTK